VAQPENNSNGILQNMKNFNLMDDYYQKTTHNLWGAYNFLHSTLSFYYRANTAAFFPSWCHGFPIPTAAVC
jgi:hypothetical protein